MNTRMFEYFELHNSIQKKRAYKNLPQKLKAPQEMILDNYKHITFMIESLSDYLQVLQIIKSKDYLCDRTYAFRGMSDYTFNMLPSIARKNIFSLAKSENAMVDELLTLRPDEFAGIKSNFDLLAKMQHFGLPTRLLDFSLNPLIALYFACSDYPNRIGRVICTNYVFYTNQNSYIESVCGMYKFNDIVQLPAENVFQNTEKLWKYSIYSPFPFMKKPPYFDDRIKNQAAVFMIFSNRLYDRIGRAAYLEQKINNVEDIEYGFDIESNDRILIDIVKHFENLENIYPTEKSIRNHRSTLKNKKIRDFSATFETIYNQYHIYKDLGVIDHNGEIQKDTMQNPFLNRYVFLDEIQPISDFSMQHYFSSILIKPKYKNLILNELDSININEKFVYPELEYTAKHVKQKYFK